VNDELYDFVGMGVSGSNSLATMSISSSIAPRSIELTAEDRIRHLVANLSAQSSCNSNATGATRRTNTSDNNSRSKQNKPNTSSSRYTTKDEAKYINTSDGYHTNARQEPSRVSNSNASSDSRRSHQLQSFSIASNSPSLHDLANMNSPHVDNVNDINYKYNQHQRSNMNRHSSQSNNSSNSNNNNNIPATRRQQPPSSSSRPLSSNSRQQHIYDDNNILSDPLAAFEVLQQSGGKNLFI
jgi:hypothetical protein